MLRGTPADSRTPAAKVAEPQLGDARTQFEAWAAKHRCELPKWATGSYASAFTRIAWDSWQAALASRRLEEVRAAECLEALRDCVSLLKMLEFNGQKCPQLARAEAVIKDYEGKRT